MEHFEYLEKQRQISIFDYLDITHSSERNKEFNVGDKVSVRFYLDEIEHVRNSHPQLLMNAIIVECKEGYYNVKFPSGEIVGIDGDKLLLKVAVK